MTISYLKKACAWALFLFIALVSTHAIASTQGQVFSGKPEKVKSFVPEDIRLFAKLGDFLNPNNVGLTVLSVELEFDSHASDVKSVFLAYIPEDFHKAHRQISAISPERIFLSKSAGPTIITIANNAEYNLSSLIRKHPDVIVIISAGNDSQPEPGVVIGRYRKHIGTNIFYGGGTKRDSDNLHHESAKPGKYGYAYIADGYWATDFKEERRISGTSITIQVIAAKLAMLYTALNTNHTWSMVDAMQLLMTTRAVDAGFYQNDLTKLLVRKGNGKVYVGSNGKTRLLPEATLRKMLRTSPLYRN